MGAMGTLDERIVGEEGFAFAAEDLVTDARRRFWFAAVLSAALGAVAFVGLGRVPGAAPGLASGLGVEAPHFMHSRAAAVANPVRVD
ncbi:MAG: hypothetical protein KGI57_04735 [Hyphomicrobiales bacterium]|nr:hypothetical protein [Hyphomicrobiales bacterium]MDE2016995.1 hypothetical protein [Hyphomicrobiales bacterium]